MNKIGEIKPKGVPDMTIYYDKKAKTNPYRVFLEWWDDTGKRQKQIERYADLSSCVIMMANYARKYNEERR